jgi:Domain of unknown function (DUF4062)
MIIAEATELVVFVASPSDIQNERETVKGVAERLQNALGLRLGLRIRVVGWEQVPPGFGRPQEQINPLVDTCNIFIGILHAKWGTESGTHSSGFIEEYERAVARLGASGSPAVAVFFKRVPQNQREDAGPQLRRVLEFKERLKNEHTLLYSDFTDTAEFEQKLTDLLLNHVGETIAKSSTGPASPSEKPVLESGDIQNSQSGGTPATDSDAALRDEAQTQLLGMLDGYSAIFRHDRDHIQFDNDRLLLFATTVSRGPFLPTHEANRLYHRRSELALTIGEGEHWLRSMAADRQLVRESRTIPGWAVVGAGAVENKAGMLLGDPDNSVVAGTLELMTSIGYRSQDLWDEARVSSGSRESISGMERWHSILANPATAAAATAHLGALAKSIDRPLLEALIASISDDSTQNIIRLVLGAVSGNFTNIAKSSATSRYPQPWMIDRLITALPQMETQQLDFLIATENIPSALRRAAASQVIARGNISADAVKAALRSGDDETEKIITDAIWQRDDADAIFRSALEGLSADERNAVLGRGRSDVVARILAATSTAEELDASMTLNANAWEARQYQRGAEGVSAARMLLSMTKESWADTLPDPLRAALHEKDLESFVYASYITAAIRYLSQVPSLTNEDIGLIRARINDTQWSIRAQAADTLSHVGTTEDARSLLSAAATANAIDRDLILRAAFILGDAETIEAAIATVDNATAETITPFLGKLSQSTLRSLLAHSAAKVRISAFDELNRQLDSEQLEELLGDYTRDGHYFYNVVVALDEAIYGPQPASRSEQIGAATGHVSDNALQSIQAGES